MAVLKNLSPPVKVLIGIVGLVLLLALGWGLFFAGDGARGANGGKEPVTIRVGHVGHDHHLACFLAADNAEKYARETGIRLEKIRDRELYHLYDGETRLAAVEFVKVGGGSRMPTALAQGVIEVGFGGVAPVLAASDKGAPLKMISPLHQKGDMFVLRPDFPADTWKQFVAHVKKTGKPVRIGYKNPVAVAKLVFEAALRHEGIPQASRRGDAAARVILVNVKGGKKLNISLHNGMIDGYAGNNPFPAIGREKQMLKIVCPLEQLPPGTFRNHPCCCIAATTRALSEKPRAITALMVLWLQATETINQDLEVAVQAASHWIGTSAQVERNSIPTSGYAMTPDSDWRSTMGKWLEAMNHMNYFKGRLRGKSEAQVASLAYDFACLERARRRLAAARSGK
jgi:sulfonate transport system substrate-binding protein